MFESWSGMMLTRERRTKWEGGVINTVIMSDKKGGWGWGDIVNGNRCNDVGRGVKCVVVVVVGGGGTEMGRAVRRRSRGWVGGWV